MKYAAMTDAVFLQRPNRFLALCEKEGETLLAHVKNTGRCKELLLPATKVWLQDHGQEPRQGKQQRKTQFSLIAVEKQTPQGTLLINMDSQAPNQVAEEALKNGKILLPLNEGEEIVSIQREVCYGDSRFDLQVHTNQRQWFVEVKGVTLESWENGERIVRFPDAPTQRGVKHIQHLIAAKEAGFGAAILFLVQMPQVQRFRPNWKTQPDFGYALQQARKAGVAVLAYDCSVTPDSLDAERAVAVDCADSHLCICQGEADKQRALSVLNEEDWSMLRQLHHGKAGEDSYCVQGLMKQAAQCLGFDDLQIRRNEKGAPVAEKRGLYVSASHTEGCCVGAASLTEIGVDVEAIAPLREKVLLRLYSPKEQAYIAHSADADYAFTLLWTLKEAYGKMRGLGLSVAKEVEFYEKDGRLCCSREGLCFSTIQQGKYLISQVRRAAD